MVIGTFNEIILVFRSKSKELEEEKKKANNLLLKMLPGEVKSTSFNSLFHP